jgi:hypothetical protein
MDEGQIRAARHPRCNVLNLNNSIMGVVKTTDMARLCHHTAGGVSILFMENPEAAKYLQSIEL